MCKFPCNLDFTTRRRLLYFGVDDSDSEFEDTLWRTVGSFVHFIASCYGKFMWLIWTDLNASICEEDLAIQKRFSE